mgnify:CR=1 FL=1
MSHEPQWARWEADPNRPAWTVGIEEEVMLVDPERWALAYRLDDVLPVLSSALTKKMSAETHACTLELAGGVVDEYRLFVYPVVLGRGRRLFADATEVPKLRLVESRPFRSGIVLLRYRTA